MTNAYTPTTEEIKSKQIITETPNNLLEALQSLNLQFDDGINKNVGEMVAFPTGRDYIPVRCRVVPSTFKDSTDEEKALYITQDKGSSISVSLATLEAIVAWAKGEKLNGVEEKR